MLVSFFLSIGLSVASIVGSVEDSWNYCREENVARSGFLTSALRHVPVSDYASITVFNHGMGCNYNAWLPQQNVHRCDNISTSACLPFQISDQVFVINGNGDIKKIDENLNYFSREMGDLEDGDIEIDLSKHTVLLYDGPDDTVDYISNYDLLSNFQNAVDSFVYLIYKETNIIPKINLIGHSRGGIINMLYAIERPDIVNTFITLGAPLFGTEWGAFYDGLLNIIHEEGYISPYRDVIDTSLSQQYMLAWNEIVLSRNIRSYLVGFYQDYDLVVNGLNGVNSLGPFSTDDVLSLLLNLVNDCPEIFLSITPDIVENVKCALSVIFPGLFVADVISQAVTSAISYVSGIVCREDFFDEAYEIIYNFFATLHDEVITYSNGESFLLSDICVDLYSQLGLRSQSINDNQAFSVTNREMVLARSVDFSSGYDLVDIDNVPVLHNMETKSPMAISRVLYLLNDSSTALHSHSYNLSFNQERHFLGCECGAKVRNQYHILSCVEDTSNDSQHIFSCNCGYIEAEPHNNTFYMSSQINHTMMCSDCGKLQTERHSYRYRNINKFRHSVTCACGLAFEENHTVANTPMGRRCSLCFAALDSIIGGGL
ncbi:MAG: hypothetical protein MJ220_04040 [Bacilli bacterium]|nr:hypothetical protein [Bacilli bacterium]